MDKVNIHLPDVVYSVATYGIPTCVVAMVVLTVMNRKFKK